VRTLDNDYNLNYIKKRVNEEIDKKLKLYNVDFYSDEYLKFSSEIIHTEVMKSIGTILDGEKTITNKLILDSIDKILKPYKLLSEVLQTSKKKNYLILSDESFGHFLNIIDMIIEDYHNGKSAS